MTKKKPNELSLIPQVEMILKEQAIAFADWKRNVIQMRKLAVLEDRDRQWQEAVLEEAAIGVVKDYYTQKSQALSKSNVNYSKEGGLEDGIFHNDKE